MNPLVLLMYANKKYNFLKKIEKKRRVGRR
jgi:hypothetical protein